MTVTFGRYELLERISVGGMAEVFKSLVSGAAGFEKIVAIKRILPNLSDDPEFVQMFVDEAKLSADLNHSNIAQVFGFGRVDDRYFIAMEYIHGKDLRRIQDSFRDARKSVPIPIGVRILLDVLEALEYAHNKCDAAGNPQGIVHRDISPQNVLISFEGSVKLIDFGIAKALTRSCKTSAGALKGKVGYMSPEQVEGVEVDHRSDIFAAGTVLWELVTGQRLFLMDNELATLARVQQGAVPIPSSVNPSIPKSLDSVILKALAVAPDARFQQAEEFHEALEQFIQLTRMSFSTKQLSRWMKSTFSTEEEVLEEPPAAAFSLASLGGHSSPQARMEASLAQEHRSSPPPPSGDKRAAEPPWPGDDAPLKRPAAPVSVAPDKPEPGKLAPDKLAPDKLAPDKLAPGKLAPDKLAPGKLAPDKLAPDKLAPDSLAPTTASPEKAALATTPLEESVPARPSQNSTVSTSGSPRQTARLEPEPVPESTSRRTVWGIGPTPDERTGGRQPVPKESSSSADPAAAVAKKPMGFGPKVAGVSAPIEQPFKNLPASIRSMAGMKAGQDVQPKPPSALGDRPAAEQGDAVDKAPQAKLRAHADRLRQLEIPRGGSLLPQPLSLPSAKTTPPPEEGKDEPATVRKQVEIVVNPQGKLTFASPEGQGATNDDPSLAPTIAPGQLFAQDIPGAVPRPGARPAAAPPPPASRLASRPKPAQAQPPLALAPLPALTDHPTVMDVSQPEPEQGEYEDADDGPTMIELAPTAQEVQQALSPGQTSWSSNTNEAPTRPTWAPEQAPPAPGDPDGAPLFRPEAPQPFQEEAQTQQQLPEVLLGEALHGGEWRRYQQVPTQPPPQQPPPQQPPPQQPPPQPHQFQRAPALSPWEQPPGSAQPAQPAQPDQLQPWTAGGWTASGDGAGQPGPSTAGDAGLALSASDTGFFHQVESEPTLPPFGAGRGRAIVLGLVALIVLGGLGGGAYALFSGSADPVKEKQERPELAPETSASTEEPPAEEVENAPADSVPLAPSPDPAAQKPAPKLEPKTKPEPKPKPKPKPTITAVEKPPAPKPLVPRPVAKPEPVPKPKQAAAGPRPKPVTRPVPPQKPAPQPVKPVAAPTKPAGKPGFLVVSSTPWAKIYLDGKDTGRSTPVPPSQPLQVAAGRHKVTLAVGSKRFDFTVTVKPGQTVQLIRALPVGR